MNRQLEQHITEALEARATTVRDLPDLGERVVTRGKRVRRRRRMYGGLAVVVAVATAVATPTVLVDRDARRTPAPPVTTPTVQPSPGRSLEPTPSATRIPRPWDTLALRPPTGVPFAVGPELFVGDQRTALRVEEILSVHRADNGFLVATRGRFTPPTRLWLVENGSQRELLSGTFGGVAVGPDGRQAAWGLIKESRRGARSELTLVELPSAKPRVTRVVEGYWDVAGFAEGRVVVSEAVDPGGRPYVWDPDAGTVTELALPWPSGSVDIGALEDGGGLMLLNPWGERCPTAVLTRQPDVALWERCDMGQISSAAVSPDGTAVAVAEWAEGPDAGHVLDGATGEALQSWVLPRRSEVERVVWEDRARVLFHVTHAHPDAGVVSALIRCEVGRTPCERVPTPDDAHITALGNR